MLYEASSTNPTSVVLQRLLVAVLVGAEGGDISEIEFICIYITKKKSRRI